MRRFSFVVSLIVLCSLNAAASTETFSGASSISGWQGITVLNQLSYSERSAGDELQSGSLKIVFDPTGSFTVGGASHCISASPGRYFIGGQFAFPSALQSLQVQVLVHYYNIPCGSPGSSLSYEARYFVPYRLGSGWNDFRGEFTAPAGTTRMIVYYNITHTASSKLTAYLDNAIATPVAETGACIPSESTLCLRNYRFAVTATWESGATSGAAKVVRFQEDESGLLWFFGEKNWEVQVKVLNGCSINNRYWVYYSATTDRKFTLRVTDTKTAATKTYVNVAGPPAPARTDVDALAVCP